MFAARIKDTWLFNVRADVLAGITVALALIPEAIAFSIIAGVDPMVGLYASFCIAVVTAFAGGRPGMISAATGAMAVLFVTLVAEHGVEYLFAATVLTGLIQLVFGALKFGRFITFIPQSVVIGFVNALAIVIFMAQLPHLIGASWQVYTMVIATLGIIYGLPRLTKAVPSPLIAIIVMTILSLVLKLDLSTVGHMGQITRALPTFHIAAVPFTWETLMIILPYALPLSLVGILESLLTATIVDEMTETSSDKNREIKGQGFANVVTGFFGGMAGCAMIGQSVINVKSGGRGRLSTLVAGVFLLFLILVLGDVVSLIPMGALVGVMVMVSISTFNWKSLIELRKMPLGDAVAMVLTVGVVVVTGDLAQGVLAGVVVSAIVFGWKMASIRASTKLEGDQKIYTITGPLFFASTTPFVGLFDPREDPRDVVIDFSGSHVWDHSGVIAIMKVVSQYEILGKRVTLIGLNEESVRTLKRGGIAVPMAS